MKTKVILSVDTEFSIAGAFNDPVRNKPVGLPAVYCEKNGRSHGLGFILDTLAEFALPATFFVEALNAHYFGHDLMGRVAQAIAATGQDVQLHLHPCWQYFKNPNWQQQLQINPPNDNIHLRGAAEIEAILLEGVDLFKQWGIAAPVAIRTGSLHVSNDVYSAMANVGIKLASNIGVGIFKPVEPELQLYSGCHELAGVIELPVLTYCDLSLGAKKHLKLLTITGSSWQELKYLLLAAAKAELDYVVILTHPSEYVKNQTDQYDSFAPNNINKNRFARLCQFLVAHPEQFTPTTFAQLHNGTLAGSPKNNLLEVPLFFALTRMLENYANDRISRL